MRGKDRKDFPSEELAKLHTLLIKRVDIPDKALEGDFVFVKAEEGTHRKGR